MADDVMLQFFGGIRDFGAYITTQRDIVEVGCPEMVSQLYRMIKLGNIADGTCIAFVGSVREHHMLITFARQFSLAHLTMQRFSYLSSLSSRVH